MESLEVLVNNLTKEDIDEYIPVYKNTFSKHPWHHEYACKNCGTQYAKLEGDCLGKCDKQEHYKLFNLAEGETNCRVCGEDISKSLETMMPAERLQYQLLYALNSRGFAGKKAAVNSKLVGFMFGYEWSGTLIHNKNKERETEINKKLMAMELRHEQVFYHNEIGISPEMQGKGIGQKLINCILPEISGKYNLLIFGTINDKLLHIYSKSIGRPQKLLENRHWYYIQLK